MAPDPKRSRTIEIVALLGKIASLTVRASLGISWALLAVAMLGEMMLACGRPRHFFECAKACSLRDVVADDRTRSYIPLVSLFQGGVGDATAVSNSAGAVWKLFLISILRVLMPVLMRFLAFCFWIFAVSANDSLGVAAKTENTDSVNYAEVRKRVTQSFPEKANEIADVVAALQEISRSTVDLSKQISAHCS